MITYTDWVILNLEGHLDPIRITTQLAVSCYLYKSLESFKGDAESTIMKAKQEEKTQDHTLSRLRRALITNDH
jgi:hypothetical protein